MTKHCGERKIATMEITVLGHMGLLCLALLPALWHLTLASLPVCVFVGLAATRL